jgi:hypothetical protein
MGTAIVCHHRPRPPGVSEHAHQEDEAALCPRSFASGWAASPLAAGMPRPRSSPPAAPPARSSPLWLACLEPVLAVALIRWRQGRAVAPRSAVAGKGLGCLPERWRSWRRVPGNRCRKRVPGANPSLKQRQGSLQRSPAGGHLAQLVQHDLEARSDLGDVGVIAAEPRLEDGKGVLEVGVSGRPARPAACGTAVRCPGEARRGGAPGLPAPLLPGHLVMVKSADRFSTWTW